MSKPHLAPDPLPYYPHPFTKRLDAIPLCPGTYQFFCQDSRHAGLIRGRVYHAASRAGIAISTRYDKCTRVLTVFS